MKIGISTTDYGQAPSDVLFGQISESGFEVIQLSLINLSESGFAPDGVFEIPETIGGGLVKAALSAKSFGLDIAALNGTFNMAHPDKRARAEGARRFVALGAAAREIGCGVVTLCTGTRNTDRLWAYSRDNDTPEAWADMADTMLRLLEIAERYELTLAVETEASNVIDTVEKARRIVDEAGSDRLAIIMDCANLFRYGEAKRENVDARIEKACRLLGDRVALAHGKDVRESPGMPEFCAAGEGVVNFGLFNRLLRECGYQGDMILHGIKDAAKVPAALAFIRKIFI